MNFCIHHLRCVNLGDIMSGPWRYFPQLGLIPLDIEDINSWGKGAIYANVVIGGGGMHHTPAGFPVEGGEHKLADVVARVHGRKIAWGIGTNYARPVFFTRPKEHPKWYGWDLAGLRDYGLGGRFEWVPCASCMHPVFNDVWKPSQSIGAFPHMDRVDRWRDCGLPIEGTQRCIDPDRAEKEFLTIIAKLAACDVVLTDSYHLAWWATLLCRAVVVINAWSTKFVNMPFPPTFATWDNWKEKVKEAKPYITAVADCQAQTRDFCARVEPFLR